MTADPKSLPERIAEMKKFHAEIVEDDGGECGMMADYRWAFETVEAQALLMDDWHTWGVNEVVIANPAVAECIIRLEAAVEAQAALLEEARRKMKDLADWADEYMHNDKCPTFDAIYPVKAFLAKTEPT